MLDSISEITSYLFISAWPSRRHLGDIIDRNIRLILAMHLVPPYYMIGKTKARFLWLPTFDNPSIKMPVGLLKMGVRAALPVIEAGGSVLTHCREGRHRSVAMACCVLIGKGFTADDAMKLVIEKRAVADPHVWYIQERIRSFESTWINS